MTARSAQLTPAASTGTGWQWLQAATDMAALLSGYWPVEPGGPGLRGTGWSGAPLVAIRTPPPAAHSVAAARAFTLRTLQRWGATDCADDVAAVLSELLTNAVRHARVGPIRFGLLHPGPCVLCAVTDASNAVPVPREPDWDAETGRGLQVVASLSHRWGYSPAPGQGGKVVWATVLTGRNPA
jgi:hypothetical protein